MPEMSSRDLKRLGEAAYAEQIRPLIEHAQVLGCPPVATRDLIAHLHMGFPYSLPIESALIVAQHVIDLGWRPLDSITKPATLET